jgi:hypothetical protein
MTAIAPQFVARKIDARHLALRVAITNLCAIADTMLDQGDVAGAADVLVQIREAQAERDRIESCWVRR